MENIFSPQIRPIVSSKHAKEWIKKIDLRSTNLFEISWEVCNQVGGIYTVIRSKVPAMKARWKDSYFLIGPYFQDVNVPEFEECDDLTGNVKKAVKRLRKKGITVVSGRWLITGKPRVILIDPTSVKSYLNEIKYYLWKDHQISTPENDPLVNDVVSFGKVVHFFFRELDDLNRGKKKNIAHFHEWMGAATAIPDIRKDNLSVKLLFTTHATQLGRYCALAHDNFYTNLENLSWEKEAENFDVRSKVDIERAATHGAHSFSAVSDIVANECEVFLSRRPDFITPNGLNIERFAVSHEFQNLHKVYKEKIHKFTMGHFFPSYSFDLNKTLYFFTSGRFEFKNKGFDLTLESLARLNKKLIETGSDVTVVMFFITKKDFHSINPQVLESRAMLEEIDKICESIQVRIGEGLFHNVAAQDKPVLPDLNSFVDEYWLLRLKRTLYSWKSKKLPCVVTHMLKDSHNDQILEAIRKHRLFNNKEDRVKIVYHPDFINSVNPLFGMDYDHFVRGCHLGIFPSYYEPWGYTPLECIARGVPTVTSNLSGFGEYTAREVTRLESKGVYILDRKKDNYMEMAEDLADMMHMYSRKTMRERISQRNRCEAMASSFDWVNLIKHYDKAYYHLTRV